MANFNIDGDRKEGHHLLFFSISHRGRGCKNHSHDDQAIRPSSFGKNISGIDVLTTGQEENILLV
jgi:hypothetical protein